MKNLTTQAHEICQSVLQRGEVAIDATAGNGHDTLFLSNQVSDNGTVYSFDIQSTAIQNTTDLLNKENKTNVTLFQADHSRMTEFVPANLHGKIGTVMFNLGYLPTGDKTITTNPDSTISAIKQSLELLRPEGLLTVLAYTGHPGGQDEADRVQQAVNKLDEKRFSVTQISGQKSSLSPPQLFVIQKQ